MNLQKQALQVSVAVTLCLNILMLTLKPFTFDETVNWISWDTAAYILTLSQAENTGVIV